MSDFSFTEEQLSRILLGNKKVHEWYEALTSCLPDYDINTLNRVAGFISQCAHESNGFTTLKENLNYRWEGLRRTFPKYFPNDALAIDVAHNPEAIANIVYANRMGNGDAASGDGWKYRGRGLIQLTGKHNHQSFGDSIQMDIADVPAYLETFEGAVKSACWFWNTNKINQYADADDILGMTKRINGGTIGLDDRKNKFNSAKQILGE